MIYDYLPQILSLTFIQIIALISPGPDFAIVVKNSLIYSRKTALLTALGVACGILIHISYTLLGLGLIISHTNWLFTIFKYIGGCYLIYIGYKGIRAKKNKLQLGNIQHSPSISSFAAFRLGFLTNLLNPKAMLFFVSLLSAFITPQTPHPVMLCYSVIFFTTTLTWFSLVAFCLSDKRMRNIFSSISHWVERVTGGFLILLGIKLLFTEIKL